MSRRAVRSILCILLLSTALYLGWVYVSVKNVVSVMNQSTNNHQIGLIYKSDDIQLNRIS